MQGWPTNVRFIRIKKNSIFEKRHRRVERAWPLPGAQ